MKSDGTDIGDRMKGYEKVSERILSRRMPVIIRIDGKAFHTVTKKYGRGWSQEFSYFMMYVAEAVMPEIQGCNFCYGQSDEISFLLTDYQTIRTDAWFGYDISKMVSISASLASVKFSSLVKESAYFDSRAFSIPQDEVCNYFIWRQQDATRNAIQMAGREHFSQKQLHKKNTSDIQEMLFKEYKINFDKYSILRKRGFCVYKNLWYKTDIEIPIFSKNRAYVEQFVYVRED